MKLSVYNQEGKPVNEVELDTSIFDGKVNQALLYQAVLMYRANKRKGLAATKTRGEVSGGGKKPWRQKGTGRARVGSSRNPVWIKGGVAHGPHPHSFAYTLPRKIKIAALKSGLNAKLKDDSLLLLDSLKLEAPKTKAAVLILKNLDSKKKAVFANKKILMVSSELDKNLELSFRNINNLTLTTAKGLNTLDILKAQKMIITTDALSALVARIKNQITKA